MQLLDVARRKMLHQQHLLKEAELHRLDDEIRKKVCGISSFVKQKNIHLLLLGRRTKRCFGFRYQICRTQSIRIRNTNKNFGKCKFFF
jgi:hypothetical protein